jgi:pimeloyl-ACP methyl ester carboxylesterase
MTTPVKSGYSEVNGIRMYYEIYGKGDPLVLIHGGGSTIQSTFSNLIPALSMHYTVIAMDLQNHGRSGFRDVPETFEQDADDVVTLLKNIGISRASFFGFSNGGTTALQISIRHPEVPEKLIVVAAASRRSGFIPGFFEGMQHAEISQMPEGLKAAFKKVNPDPALLQKMFERDRDRMITFSDISDEMIRSITAPSLVINGDRDVVTVAHALEMSQLISGCRLAILPGEHGKYIGEMNTGKVNDADIGFVVSMVNRLLDGNN